MIVGIGGVSRAGKTTLARLLKEHLLEHAIETIVLSQDDFVNLETKIPLIKDRIDWEDPLSIDHERFIQNLKASDSDNKVIIAEGLFAFYWPQLIEMYDLSIFIKISKRLFLERKKIDLRWGSKAEPAWYMEHIWKSYRANGKINIPDDCLRIKGSKRFDIDAIAKTILSTRHRKD